MHMLLVGVALTICVVPAFAAAPVRPAITGVAYVRVYTNDPEASHKFYAERLKLPEVTCAGNECKQYQVNKYQYVQVLKANREVSGMNMIAFRTSDAEAMRKYLAGHGVRVPATLQKSSDDSREFEIADPEGHRIAFVQSTKESDQHGAISRSFIHAGVVVKDRAKMDAFYKDVLGFRPYWYGGFKDDHPIWVSQQVPDGSDWLEYMLDIPADANHQELGVQNHFALGVRDVDDAAKELTKSGWQPSDREHPQMGRDGKRQLNVYDPDDVRVEFMEFKPREKPCCSEYTASHPEPQ
jgi:catechol 2,3-dioxygenase-like lactoylglutathione lyase family enzyme